MICNQGCQSLAATLLIVASFLMINSESLHSGQKDFDEKFLLDNYRDKLAIPKDLLKVYVEYAKAAKIDQDPAKIRPFCLSSVEIETEARQGNDEVGNAINIHHLRKWFHPKILLCTRDNEDVYYLRTGTSKLGFVNTRSQGWKLFYYLDFPIE